ncbi:hypothetical protein DXG01_012525 [Tephrocybe rancida]|nr:hypothetical protein DXG01_012525 [Tephrocybe rancida]
MLSKDGYSLCLRKATLPATNGKPANSPVANLVAATIHPRDYSRINTLQWNEEYAIAATKQPYKEGDVLVEVDTDILDIKTANNQALVLTDWATYEVTTTTKPVPAEGFDFLPSVEASCIVYLKDLHGSSDTPPFPFYISPTPDVPESINQLTPIESVIAVFYKDAQSGSMITSSSAYETDPIDLTNDNRQAWELYKDASGKAAWRKVNWVGSK